MKKWIGKYKFKDAQTVIEGLMAQLGSGS